MQRIGLLQQVFLGHQPTAVLSDLREIRDMELEGLGLLRRLEALRERYRLTPPEDGDAGPSAETEVVRIVCSEGLSV